ncbi:uncharacterized protein LOC143856812 [Tasmannia lanceolata]|uniref:uncharacterized protein LOC143856812 n=1 Tax=Tasmannia lanceolata TaxID=3420 RepID=UPI0040631176
MAAAMKDQSETKLPTSAPSSSSGRAVGVKDTARSPPRELEPPAKRVAPSCAKQGKAGRGIRSPAAFAEDMSSRLEGSIMTKLLLDQMEFSPQCYRAQGELFKPDWKIGVEDGVLGNPRVGVELGLITALPGDEAKLENFPRRALRARYLHSMSCVQSYARKMLQYMVEDESEIGAFEDRVRKMSEDLEKAQAEKAALDDTVSQLRGELQLSEDGRNRAEKNLVVTRKMYVEELVKAREEWRDSEEFFNAAASFSVDIEIDAFFECRRRVREVDPSFPFEKLVHEAEEAVPEDHLPEPVDTTRPVEDPAVAPYASTVIETSAGGR